MNIDNINKTIDLIKFDKSMTFDMSKWYNEHDHDSHTCGTAACIAGYAVVAESRDGKSDVESFGYSNKALNYLDISPAQAAELFMPENINAYKATKEQGIDVLEYFRDTGGIVDWDRVVGAWTGE